MKDLIQKDFSLLCRKWVIYNEFLIATAFLIKQVYVFILWFSITLCFLEIQNLMGTFLMYITFICFRKEEKRKMKITMGKHFITNKKNWNIEIIIQICLCFINQISFYVWIGALNLSSTKQWTKFLRNLGYWK